MIAKHYLSLSIKHNRKRENQIFVSSDCPFSEDDTFSGNDLIYRKSFSQSNETFMNSQKSN